MDTSLISRPGGGINLPNTKDDFQENFENVGVDVVKETFELLEKGEKEIKLDKKYQDAIMILGNTGSGKTTFTQWIAGNNSELISKETFEGSGEYIIEGPGIGNSTLKSETIFPELVVDTKTNAAYYDCPGFSDTQGTSREIAETYFIKKVLDFSKSLKMIFTINHSSVRKGVDRQDFMKLLRHITDLVKDVEKFKHSIAMVVTKVDNQYRKQNGTLILVGDDKVIAGISDFLQEAKIYLEDNSKRPDLSIKKKNFYKNAIKFVDILLPKKGENCPRIGLFRRPDMPGPVSDIKLLQDGKRHIEVIAYQTLNFTSKSNNDFGYTVSDETKNDINEIVEEINKNLWSTLSSISDKIQEYCEILVEQIRSKIKSLYSDVKVVDANPSEATEFRYKFISAYNGTSELISKTSNLTNPEELATIVNTTISKLNIHIPKDDILYITTQGQYFNFLQTVSDKKFSSKQWNQVFKRVEIFLSSSKTIILEDVAFATKSINLRFQTMLNETVEVINKEYMEIIKSVEIENLPFQLKEDYRIIGEVIDEIKKEETTEKLVNGTAFVARHLRVSLSKENLQNLTNQGKYFKYLELLSDNDINVDTTMWLSPFKSLAKYLNESEKWYSFLEDLYNKFSLYDAQKDRQRYNVANLEDWGQPGKPQGISITPVNFATFLQKIKNFNVTEYETVKNMKTTTGLQIEELNEALSLTLKHRPVVRCSENNIFVKGHFISLIEIMENLLNNVDSNNSCKNFKYQLEAGKYHLFKIFALNKVFMDTDLSFVGKRLSVAIISPMWEVVGSKTIAINGFDGPPHADSKAKNGAKYGNNGSRGAPGNPGVSGEHFFGVGATFLGGSNLNINSNGGTGGPGQDGGDGAPGEPGDNGKTPLPNDDPCSNGYFQGFKCDTLEIKNESNAYGKRSETTFKIYGKPGGNGGNGGDGGRGGIGGYSGNITILELDLPSNITKLASKGKEGATGGAGAGGQGGKNGDDIKATFLDSKSLHCLDMGCVNAHTKNWLTFKTTKIVRVETGKSGSNGNNGGNSEGIRDPEPAYGNSGLPYIINDYKTYLRENINNRISKVYLLRFIEQLNSNNGVRNLYDTLALTDEFQGMEEQFHKLRGKIDFPSFYNSFLDRIYEFAKNLKEGPSSNENKKVLNYLYTAALGRIHNLRDNSETNLIIDIRKYLNLIEDNIKILRDLNSQNNKIDVVNEYKKNYKKGIDTKIKEATSFINKQVSPEIEKINEEIGDQVNILVEETIELQKDAEKNIKELAEQKKKLAKSLEMTNLFSCFQIIGGFVQLLGPIGIIAGTVINTVGTVGDALAINDQKILDLPSDVASGIKDVTNQIKSIRNKKVSHLQKLLDDVSEEIKKNPEKLSDMEGKINDIQEKLNKVSENKLDYKQVKTLENDLNKELERKADDLKSNPNDSKGIKALKAIEKIAKVLEFGSLLLRVSDNIKEEKKKMDVVDDAMKELQDQLKALREYEEHIYDTIMPMLSEMMEHMKDISEKLGTKSQVALDVTKWQVQSNLKDIKLEMQRMTEGFSVKDELSRSIEKLDEVMTTLIIIYDRIENYKDQKNLGDYIGDISSVAANRIDIKDQKLVNAVNRLEFVIRANIVIVQYKSAFGALKQWVFPFADRYMEKLMLPSQIEENANIEDLVENAVEQIEAIKQKIELYDSSIKNGDEYILCEEFSSRYVSSKPFFVWKNEDFGMLISNLFSGKAGILKADVKNSSPSKQAIKFSEIDFYFKIKNETEQSLLSETLKGFDIRATHLGNSYYKYENKIFLIISDSVTISYSYEKNHGIPIRSNEVYNRLKSGDLLLSPYTLWEARLINKTERYSYEDLEKFKNSTNLELSGFGSYIETNKFETSSNISDSPGVNQCKRSKSRLARSVEENVGDVHYVSNNAPKGMLSPINIVFNFLKSYLVTFAITSVNHIFITKQRFLRNYEDCSNLPHECTKTKNTNALTLPNLTIKSVIKIGETTTGIETKSEITSYFKFNGNNSCSKPFLLYDEKEKWNNHSTQVPDLNCTLLLADLVTRTITGNRYKSPVNECLQSPREVISRKICNGLVQNESDLKQMLLVQLSEKEDEEFSSWFNQMNAFSKSMFQYLGFVRDEE